MELNYSICVTVKFREKAIVLCINRGAFIRNTGFSRTLTGKSEGSNSLNV